MNCYEFEVQVTDLDKNSYEKKTVVLLKEEQRHFIFVVKGEEEKYIFFEDFTLLGILTMLMQHVARSVYYNYRKLLKPQTESAKETKQ